MEKQGEEDNPFSYKAFLKRSADEPSDKKKGKKKASQKTQSQPSATATSQGSNPFSFKHFVASRVSDDTTKVFGESSDSEDDTTMKPSTIIPPKVKHKHDKLFSSESSESDSEATAALLPGNPRKHSNTDKGDIPLVISSHNASDDSFSDHSDVEGGKPLLPNMVNNDGRDITSFAYDETLLVENNKLKNENTSLKSEVVNLKEAVKAEKKRYSELKTKIAALKKKESEETKALENMVAKVEANLVASTQRAVAAEATISELKKEIVQLKGRLATTDTEAIHQQHELVLNAVREKAAYASQNLYSAAEKADQSIRELLSGVDTLKNIADILIYIDRVALTKSTTS